MNKYKELLHRKEIKVRDKIISTMELLTKVDNEIIRKQENIIKQYEIIFFIGLILIILLVGIIIFL